VKWARGAESIDAEIERIIAGPLQVDSLDLLDQVKLEESTRALLQLFFAPAWTRSEALLAHARLFFLDFAVSTSNPSLEPLAAQLHDADPSILDYVAYVLLDFAVADPALHDLPMAQALQIADGLGLRSRLEEKASKELKLSKKALATLRDEGPGLLAKAGQG
jgi:hypothetical protein